jgi:extracellular elastinolytic metalloproteinase
VARDGTVFSYSNSFFDGEIPSEAPAAVSDPLGALSVARDTLQLSVSLDSAQSTEESQSFSIKGASGAMKEPEVKQVYLAQPEGGLALTWRVETILSDSWLLSYVSDAEPKVLNVVDYTSHATYEV